MTVITITLDGVGLKDIALTKARTTLGRRPYNDIVMDHLAVSGEHAAFLLHDDGGVELLDLHSTNGSYVNGKAIDSARVGPADLIEIGRYQIRIKAPTPPPAPPSPARLEVTSGPATGRVMTLSKTTTTLGKPGLAVAAIHQHEQGYTIALVEGHNPPTLNGTPVGTEPQALRHGDRLVLAGTEMQFLCQTTE